MSFFLSAYRSEKVYVFFLCIKNDDVVGEGLIHGI